MHQGRRAVALCAAIALAAFAAAALPSFAARKSDVPVAGKSVAAKQTTRQFTGVVTALDKTSLTVEKGGKKPRTMVFTRHADLRTVGDLQKDCRATVYYREQGRELVALRVVVKPASGGAGER